MELSWRPPNNFHLAILLKQIGAIAFVTIIIAVPFITAAQSNSPLDVSTCSALETVVNRFTRSLGFIALLAAAIVVIVGAFYLVFGGGSDTTASRGRQLIIYGLVGIAVALIAFTLPRLVLNILGAASPTCGFGALPGLPSSGDGPF